MEVIRIPVISGSFKFKLRSPHHWKTKYIRMEHLNIITVLKKDTMTISDMANVFQIASDRLFDEDDIEDYFQDIEDNLIFLLQELIDMGYIKMINKIIE